MARGGPVRLSVTAPIALSSGPGRATAGFTVREGERVDFRVAFVSSFAGSRIAEREDEATIEDTIAGWESWVKLHSCYAGRHAEAVRRSSLVLQGLTYQQPERWSPPPPPRCPRRSAQSSTSTTAMPGCATSA